MAAVVIPAYNAEATIGSLLGSLPAVIEKESVVVVVDGSSDNTGFIASEWGAVVIRHDVNQGKGAALRTGIDYVLRSKVAESVITMDADLQHNPAEIPQFLSRGERGGVDMIVGYRKRLGSGMPIHRVLSNVITSSLVSARTGMAIRDSQSGYRWISTKVLQEITIESDGYEAETEMLIKAARKGFRIDFVPIATIYGNERSHMTHWKTTMRFLRVLMKEY